MKKKVLTLILLLCLIITLSINYYFLWLKPLNFKNASYEIVGANVKATLTFSQNVLNGNCMVNNQTVAIENHQCIIEIPNEETNIKVKTSWNEINLTLDPKQDKVLDFTLSTEKVYLAIDEEKEISIETDTFGNPDQTSNFVSDDENIVTVNNNILKAVGNGKTKVHVTVGDITKDIEVIATNLVGKPVLTKEKAFLPCGIYSEEDNKILDEFLEYRINSAGYKTRGAVVAAARFLTLEFPYRIDYFWENGRLENTTGGPSADGEGRYYHKGLYLNSIKFNELDQNKIRYGPATWGCPLTNWEDDPDYGFYPGTKVSNGLDCSGFVTWVLYNAGFDPKDVGAGDNPAIDGELSDLGEHIPLTRSLLESNTLKPGDFIGADGHAALIGGFKDDIIYVAQSLNYGMEMKPYTYDEILNTAWLSYVIRMDDYYQEEGIYTNYWE